MHLDPIIPALCTLVRKAVRHVSNVAGLRQQYYFPFAKLEEVAQQSESADTEKSADKR